MTERRKSDGRGGAHLEQGRQKGAGSCEHLLGAPGNRASHIQSQFFWEPNKTYL